MIGSCADRHQRCIGMSADDPKNQHRSWEEHPPTITRTDGRVDAAVCAGQSLWLVLWPSQLLHASELVEEWFIVTKVFCVCHIFVTDQGKEQQSNTITCKVDA